MDGGEAAVGAVDLAGDELCRWGEEEGGEGGDIGGIADGFERMAIRGCGAAGVVGQEGGSQAGVGEGGGDGVDANFGRPFRSEGAGESLDRAFGGGDAGVEGHAGGDRDGAEEDHGGGVGFLESGQGGLEDADGPEEVDLEVVEEVGFAEAMEGLQIDGAGAVDEAVDGFREGREWRGVGGVEGEGFDAKGGELIGAATEGEEPIAVRGEGFGKGEANAGVAADQENVVLHGAPCAGGAFCLPGIGGDGSLRIGKAGEGWRS